MKTTLDTMSRRAAAVLSEQRTQEELAAAPEAGDEGEDADASFQLEGTSRFAHLVGGSEAKLDYERTTSGER